MNQEPQRAQGGSGNAPQAGFDLVSTCAMYAVAAHLLLAFLAGAAMGCWRAEDPGAFLVHVLTSPKLYGFALVYGVAAWVALILLAYAARKLFRGGKARAAFVLIVFCYWRPIISLIGSVTGAESFDARWLLIFPLVLGWSPAIFLWLLRRRAVRESDSRGL